MWSIEFLHIHLLSTILCQLTLGLVLVQRSAFDAAQWPTAFVAIDVIVGLDAVQAAHANRCRDLCRTTHQWRLL